MLLSLGILMIIGVVFLFAFTVAFGYDYTFTLEYFKEGVIHSHVMINSWVASISTAAITTVLGIALAFLTIRKNDHGFPCHASGIPSRYIHRPGIDPCL